jgi:hypothetical protein
MVISCNLRPVTIHVIQDKLDTGVIYFCGAPNAYAAIRKDAIAIFPEELLCAECMKSLSPEALETKSHDE